MIFRKQNTVEFAPRYWMATDGCSCRVLKMTWLIGWQGGDSISKYPGRVGRPDLTNWLSRGFAPTMILLNNGFTQRRGLGK